MTVSGTGEAENKNLGVTWLPMPVVNPVAAYSLAVHFALALNHPEEILLLRPGKK